MIPCKILSPGGQLPAKKHLFDAGHDLYSSSAVTVPPGSLARVNTSIAIALPRDCFALIVDRSSMAGKGLHVLGGVIDPDYRGELVVCLMNLLKEPYDIQLGDRIAQLLLLPLPAKATFVEVTSLDLTTRNDGGFGSTGL